MNSIKIPIVGLFLVLLGLPMQGECLLQVTKSTNVRNSPDSSFAVVRQLPPQTIVEPVKALQQGKENWLQINQPLVGWLSLKSVITFCGKNSQEQTTNTTSLKVRGMAGDTRAVEKLIYFIYKGAEGEVRAQTIGLLGEVLLANPVAVVSVLDNQVEIIRRQILTEIQKPGFAVQGKERFEQTLQRFSTETPTIKTWKSLGKK